MHSEFTYRTLLICGASIALIFSVCFFLLKIPKKESLKSYRISRSIMALAYFVVGILNIIEIIYIDEGPDAYLTSLNTLIIAAFLSILFTFTLLTLIDTQFVSKWKIYRELIPVLIFSVAVCFSYFSDFNVFFKPIYYFFVTYYISLIIRFSFIFFKNYRLYVRKIDNYFSVQLANKLRWVKTAYYATMATGCTALVSLYVSYTFAPLFNLFYLAFFIYFGIRFLNYIYIFQEIETAITPVDTKTAKEEKENSFSFDQLERLIEEWEQKKLFTESGITIEQVAGEIKTNRTYLSNYINTYKKMTFNEWINHLRIEEAKTLLIKNPQLPVSQIGVMIGLPDKSNFGRQFSKQSGCSPLAWRTKQQS